MTALNYLSLADGVVLFSETAVFDKKTRITSFTASKIRTPEGGRFGYICSGSAKLGDEFDEWVQRTSDAFGRPVTFDLATRVASTYMDLVRSDLEACSLDPDHKTSPKLAIGLAGWSDVEQRWRGGITYSWKLAHQPAGFVYPSHNQLWPVLRINGGARLLEKVEIGKNLAALGPEAFATAVLKLQRRLTGWRGPDGDTAECIVCGQGQIVSITSEAVVRGVLCEWDDRIGDDQSILELRVKSEPAPVLPHLLSRAELRRMMKVARKDFERARVLAQTLG